MIGHRSPPSHGGGDPGHDAAPVNFSWRKFKGAAAGNGAGLALLLVFVVVLPSACLLWFMKEAMQNERLAVRQKLAEAYRGHLSLAAERLNAYWERTVDPQQRPDLSAPLLFARSVNDDLADALICFAANGVLSYPEADRQPAPQANSPDWNQAEMLEFSNPSAAAEAFGRLAASETDVHLVARALQAQARCLLRADDKPGAFKIAAESLAEPRFEKALDGQGRLIVPDAELMVLEISHSTGAPSGAAVVGRLQARLNDYASRLPSAQRRFLMQEMRKLYPETVFPTLAAEDLAHQFLEQRPRPADVPIKQLRPSGLTGVWQVVAADRRMISLHRQEALVRRLKSVIARDVLTDDITLQLLPPGVESAGVLSSMAAGPALEGWTLALSLKDQAGFEAGAGSRVGSYVGIGVAAVLGMLLLGLLALGLLRRQVALTRLRNDLVANVTHELKTPLSSMRLLVDTLLQTDIPPATARDYLQLIARENMRLSRLIDNFLTFSRIERNKFVFAFQELPPNRIAEDAAAAVRERFQGPGCRFETRLSSDLPAIKADPEAMVAALVNLLDNAWKYSGDEKQIQLRSSTRNGDILFSVEDNGIGLPERERARIFKRFYQVQRPAHVAGGCGLGLSIVQFIVSAHGGKVEVESQPQKGSVFTLVLPALAGSPKEGSAL